MLKRFVGSTDTLICKKQIKSKTLPRQPATFTRVTDWLMQQVGPWAP